MKPHQALKISEQVNNIVNHIDDTIFDAREICGIRKKYQKYETLTLRDVQNIYNLRDCIQDLAEWLQVEDEDGGLDKKQLKKFAAEVKKSVEIHAKIPGGVFLDVAYPLLSYLDKRF